MGQGACLPGGVCLWEGVPREGVPQGGVYHTPQMATNTGGTHPTGMDSCLNIFVHNISLQNDGTGILIFNIFIVLQP